LIPFWLYIYLIDQSPGAVIEDYGRHPSINIDLIRRFAHLEEQIKAKRKPPGRIGSTWM
jgi:hypothetical protein